MMDQLSQDGLDRRVSPPQGEEPHPPRGEVELDADQAIRTLRIDGEAVPQYLHRSQGICPPQIHDLASGMRLEVQPPPLRERAPWRGRLDPVRSGAMYHRHVPA